MRTRLALVPLLAGALVLGACGDSEEATGDGATDAATAPASDGATEPGTAAPSDAASQPALVSEDLPDGVAATVGDTTIAAADLEERLALIREIPQVKQQLEGDSATQVEAQLASQALGQLVLQSVVLRGAAQEDVEVGDDQVDERRTQLTEDAGGEEAFAEQLSSAGVPEAQVGQELRASIAFELVTEKLLADAGIEQPTETPTAAPSEGGTEPASPDPEAQQAQQVQQDWLLGLVADTDVVVDEAYGAWDPSSGQVVPA